jgi:hypothetical protein
MGEISMPIPARGFSRGRGRGSGSVNGIGTGPFLDGEKKAKYGWNRTRKNEPIN